jgi:hypothetical protein
MGRVERLLPSCVVRRIDDFLDFRGDPFQHDFESLPQCHLRGCTSLAAAAFSLDLDNADNIDTNIEYDGLYLNGFFHF